MYATEMSIRRRDRVTERSSEQMKVRFKKRRNTQKKQHESEPTSDQNGPKMSKNSIVDSFGCSKPF